ncbi:MAG: hypothetical protein KDD70_12355, partial [Bdellovibrionales bacterium]|nr:hypothetical protein [Bdellovibrionales bacterium]
MGLVVASSRTALEASEKLARDYPKEPVSFVARNQRFDEDLGDIGVATVNREGYQLTANGKQYYLTRSENRDRREAFAGYLEEKYGATPGPNRFLKHKVLILAKDTPPVEQPMIHEALESIGWMPISDVSKHGPTHWAELIHALGIEIAVVQNAEMAAKLRDIITVPHVVREITNPATGEYRKTEVKLSLKEVIALENFHLQDTGGLTFTSYRDILRDGPRYKSDLDNFDGNDPTRLIPVVAEDGPPLVVVSSDQARLRALQISHGTMWTEKDSIMANITMGHAFGGLTVDAGYLSRANLNFLHPHSNPRTVAAETRQARPTIIPVTPLHLEKVAEGILKSMGEDLDKVLRRVDKMTSGLTEWTGVPSVLRRMARVALKSYSDAVNNGERKKNSAIWKSY